jgi:hypothetical protein
MKVHFKNLRKYYTDIQIDVIKDFVVLCQKEIQLNKDVHIYFLGKRKGHMTTGVRFPGHEICILAHNRLLIDVLRTLSHEWVHEMQHQKLGLKDTDKIQDIGGEEENMSNIISGMLVKTFEKEYPNYKKLLYGED